MSTIELVDLVGEQTEYAVRVTEHPGAVVPYYFGAGWVKTFVEANARSFTDPIHGYKAEAVSRTVTFGEWSA
jgi:hypothetical protein